ncbi:hypothetical protein KKE14_00520 [Patescibacteria group bacterium]|nr:hypothetical protein [Patescibacteria group bacterium]
MFLAQAKNFLGDGLLFTGILPVKAGKLLKITFSGVAAPFTPEKARRTLAKEKTMTKKRFSPLAAGVLALAFLVLLSVGCGGGSDPIVPQPPAEQPIRPLEWFAGIFIDQQPDGSPGGKIIQAINLPKGEETFVWFRAISLPGSYNPTDPKAPWVAVMTEYTPQLTIEGASSGSYMPNPGLKRVQCVLNAGAQYKVVFQPPQDSALGPVHYYLEIKELGIKTDLWVAVVNSSAVPPPPTSCRDLHPTPETDYEGNLWDCVDGNWVIIDPVDPPPPPPSGEFHAHGAFGEFHSGDTLHIQKGRAEIFQLFVGESSVNSQQVTADLPPSLPWWVWMSETSELSTVYAVGNPIYVPVGEYDLSLWYEGKELVVHFIVDYNDELP